MPSSNNTKTFRPLGNLLKPCQVAGVTLFSVIEQLQSIEKIWRNVVSPDLAEHSRPTHYADGQVTVCADSPVWASNIRHHQVSFLRLLRARGMSDVRSLRVRVSPVIPPPKASPPVRDRTPLHVVRAIRSSANAMPDGELRTALLKLSKALRS